MGNAELRFPLFGLLGLGGGYYGFLPVEAALFYDAGVAWTSYEGAKLFGDGPRGLVTSTGVSLRMNLFGFAIGQLDYVRPFDRPGKDWMLRASLTPGYWPVVLRFLEINNHRGTEAQRRASNWGTMSRFGRLTQTPAQPYSLPFRTFSLKPERQRPVGSVGVEALPPTSKNGRLTIIVA